MAKADLIDKAIQALALRWARGRVEDARGRGSEMLKLLDGNKRLVVTLVYIVSGLVLMLTGHDIAAWLDLGLRALGWTDAKMIAAAKELATQIVPLLFAAWAALSALWKMWRQWEAGATAVEINSPVGVVKAALADGSLAVASGRPTTLVMSSDRKPLAGGPVTLVVQEGERRISLKDGDPIPPLQRPGDRRAIDELPREGE